MIRGRSSIEIRGKIFSRQMELQVLRPWGTYEHGTEKTARRPSWILVNYIGEGGTR